MFPKALACGADIVCVELEDGIAPKDKEEARIKALSLFTIPQPDDGVERIVRINGLRTAYGLADVQADSPQSPGDRLLGRIGLLSVQQRQERRLVDGGARQAKGAVGDLHF